MERSTPLDALNPGVHPLIVNARRRGAGVRGGRARARACARTAIQGGGAEPTDEEGRDGLGGFEEYVGGIL